jgi:hypothetical protein
MSSPIVYSIWNTKTQSEWLESANNKLGSDRRYNCPVGTIVICVNSETKCIFGVGILGSSFAPSDTGAYSGTDSKYNKYQAELRHFRRFAVPISFETINRICDIRSEANHYNSYTKHVWANYVALRYKPAPNALGPDEATVTQRFRELVMTWI